MTGVRAFNVRADLRANYQRLFDYAQNGGTLIVQYNVLEGGPFGGDPALLEHIGPYPITISRDRVTDGRRSGDVSRIRRIRCCIAPNEITEQGFRRLGAGARPEFRERMGPEISERARIARSRRGAACPAAMLYTQYGKGVYIFSAYSLVPRIAGRRSRRLSHCSPTC